MRGKFYAYGQQARASLRRTRPFALMTGVAVASSLAIGLSACSDESYVPTAECANGAERDEACGAFGTQLQRCDRFQWVNVGDCQVDIPCALAETRTEKCGLNSRGEVTEVCTLNGWKPHQDGCEDADACADDSTSSESCGLNLRGEQRLLCEDGQWELKECDDSDICVDGDLDIAACDLLGNSFRERPCIEGQWSDDWSICQMEVCDADDVDLVDCGFEDRGVRRTRCIAGQWSESPECEMRGTHVAMNETHLFLIGEDDSLWVAGSAEEPISGRAVSASSEAMLRQPFDTRFYVTSADHFAVSNVHACAIEAGEVFCWGDNSQGQLGVDVSLANSRTPVQVSGVGGSANPAAQVVVTSNVSCARLLDGDVRCWGWNGDDGGVGAGKKGVVSAPVRPKGFQEPNKVPPAERLFARDQVICAQTQGGDVYCWGDNTRKPRPGPTCVLPGFSCRPMNPPTILEPTKVTEIRRAGLLVSDLHIYRYNSCAHYSNGAVYCWGRNDNGERGDGSKTSGNSVDLAVGAGANSALSIHSSSHRRCARMADGTTLRCWGRQTVGDANARMIPSMGAAVRAPEVSMRFELSESPIASLTISDAGACAVHEDAVVRCTGVSSTGSFGRNEKPVSQGDAKPVLCPAE